MPDHIHMLVSIPPKMSVSSFIGYLNRSKIEKCSILNGGGGLSANHK